MTENSHVATIRRLTRGGRPPKAFGDISPAKAMRLAIAKAGQDVLTQPIMGSGLEELQSPVQKLTEILPENPLCMMMRGPEEGTGLAILDRSAVFAVTEALTKGIISDVAPPDRPLTTTDGFLCQEFLQVILTVFSKRLEAQPSASWAASYEIDEMIRDLRRLPLLMQDVAYRVMTMDCDFGAGAKIGQVVLVYPWDGPFVSLDAEPPAQDLEATEDFQKRMMKSVGRIEIELAAVLNTYQMTYEALANLKAGDKLRISRRQIHSVEMQDDDGRVFAKGEFGKFMGEQAVRITHLADGTPLAESPEDAQTLDEPEVPDDPMASMGLDLAEALASAPSPTGGSMSDLPGPPDPPPFDPDNFDMPDLDLEAPYPDGEIPGLTLPGEDDNDIEPMAPLDLGDLPMTSLDDLPETID